MKQIVVLMSGGIDSFVSAMILKDKGYQVSGIHFVVNSNKFHLHIGNSKAISTISNLLKIDIQTIDITNQFIQNVLKETIDTYKKGVTPNPCITCNQTIKFGYLLEKVNTKSIATGHYIKLRNEDNEIKLLEPKDKSKDQRYFLYRVSPSTLQRCTFPLEDITKDEVTKHAQKWAPQLFLAENYKPSSDLCFMQHTHINNFLAKFIKSKPGQIIDFTSKKILGKHTGLWKFTKGQRKGIKIEGIGPFFVHSKIIKDNILYVTQDLAIVQTNLIEFVNPRFILERYRHTKQFDCNVQTRYGAPKIQARVNTEKKTIITKQSVIASPGQSAVFYTKDDILIGGGIIVS